MEIPPTIQRLIAFGVVALVFVVMQIRRKTPTDLLFLTALAIMLIFGMITPTKAFEGFSNRAIFAIGGLLVISAALRNSGVLDVIGRWLLQGVRSEQIASLRISGILIGLSAFVLNTALVAMILPVVINWCRQTRVAASRMLIPISYVTILGGTCTLVGTSTNLIVDGELRKTSASIAEWESVAGVTNEVSDVIDLKSPDAKSSDSDFVMDAAAQKQNWLMQRKSDLQPMGLTEISRIGIPCAIVGLVFLLAFGQRWMPTRSEMLGSVDEQSKEYLVEMLVQPSCILVGKSVEEGGLRNLPGLFLIEIDRRIETITPVAPTDHIQANDRLVFTGIVSTIVDLEKIPGLVPISEEESAKAKLNSVNKTLVEVVLSPSSPLIGKSIRQANFRQMYNAVVMAVHRNGRRIPSKIGDIQLEPGDTLLLQARPSFLPSYQNSREFYLVSSVTNVDTRRLDKLYTAGSLGVLLIVWLLALPILAWCDVPLVFRDPPVIIMLVALAFVGTRCLPAAQARESIDWSLLLTIGAAIGIGEALENSGAARALALAIIDIVGANPWVLLATIYLITVIFTEMLSNAAVAALMYKIAIDVAFTSDLNPRTFIMAVTLAASLSFISPIGYQTNLMVMGPGGYKPSDYVRVGGPLSLIVGIVAIALLPLIWPF